MQIHEELISQALLIPLFFSVTTAVTLAELHLMTFQGGTPVNSQLLLKELKKVVVQNLNNQIMQLRTCRHASEFALL